MKHAIVLSRLTYYPQATDMQELLNRLGWTQKYFAERVGVDERTVGRWCLGEPSTVAVAYLGMCARMMGV